MAFVGKPRDDQQYGRLLGMIQPEATPTKRVGTETPTGAVTAGPKAGQGPEQFTKAAGSPGTAFGRQLAGADISGITKLAEQPLLREAGQEASRVAGEAKTYQQTQAGKIQQAPQYSAKELEGAVGKLGAGDTAETEKAQQILTRADIPVDKFTTTDIKEFTPLQALRGGSVESLLKKEAAGPYTTGMAGLDALLFQKKGGAAQLGQRGQALRTTEQMIADLLQGKGQGVVGEAMQKELEKRGLSADLTKQAQEKAKQFVESQKTGLTEGIKKGITGKEEAYTKAPEGQKSKLQEAQERIQSEYGKSKQEATNKAYKYAEELKQNTLQAIAEQTAARLFPEAMQQPFGILAVLSNPEMMAQIQNDPTFKKQQEQLSTQVTTPFTGGLDQYQRFIQKQDIPTLGLANVMSPEDAAAYNRLQELIGGQAIKQQTLATPQATLNEQAMRDAFNELVKKSGLFSGQAGPAAYYRPT